MGKPQKSPNDTESLCNACGLCCNGVIFADVQLRPGEQARLRQVDGLSITASKTGERAAKLCQPCAAHNGCKCNIYSERPKYCREFECLLLKDVLAGRITHSAALRIIDVALKDVKKANRLLKELGDQNETLPLRLRFKQISKRLEQESVNVTTAALYGELTLTMHRLNGIIAERFYSGNSVSNS